MLLTELRILVVDTARVWWRLLPQVLAIYLLGWLGSEAALKVAAHLLDVNTWIALGVFALSFLSQLVAVIIILQLAGSELGIRGLIPQQEATNDARDQSLTNLLAVTLLPFLGLYAAFGEVSKAAARLVTEQQFRNGPFAPDTNVLGVLNVLATEHTGWFLLGLVGLYVVRRVLDEAYERTGRRLLGFLVAFVESFFLLVIILGGIRIWQLAKLWLQDRRLVGWWAGARDAVADVLSVISAALPAMLGKLAGFVAEQIWPLFWEVVSQPIVWLAVAALVFGSQVLSLAELWRKGQPVVDRVPGLTVFARHRDKVAARGPRSPGARRVAGEMRAAFLGDLDDKYLPTFHSLRLVLRAGGVFLGAFVAVYTLVRVLQNYFESLLYLPLGGHEVVFWFTVGPFVDLSVELPFEPLRLCLLAVAFRRCLELFRQRSEPAATPAAVPKTEPAQAPA